MSRKYSSLSLKLILAVAFLAAACSKESHTPPPLGPKTQELLRRIPETEPEWVFNAEDLSDDENLYFVGISKKFREERDAKSDARIDAGNQFVEYCGVETRVFNEFLSQSVGLSSEVVDSTETKTERSKMRSEAYFSRLKIQSTSTEIFKEVQSEKEVGRFYKIKVLTRIPKSEYQRVQDWKKETKKERNRIAKGVLDNKMKSIESNAEKGFIIDALREIEELKSKASQEETPDWELYTSRADEIRSSLLGGYKIIPLGTKQISMSPLESTPPISVKVVVLRSGSEAMAVPKFPLLFNSGGQRETIFTGKDGIATLQIPPPEAEGSLKITASADIDSIESPLPKDAIQAIRSQSIKFHIDVKVNFLKNLAKSDFQLHLDGFKDGETIKVGDGFNLSTKCMRRCRVRLYTWDGQKAELLFNSGKRKLVKGKTKKIGKITPDEEGEYRIIAISTSDKFSNQAETGTTYDFQEFELLLKNFRSASFPKSETHLRLNVIK